MNPRKQLEHAISILNAHRDSLSDAVVDISIEAIHHELARLETEKNTSQQRRLVSILFVDVVSSTKTFENLDPEDVLVIMNDVLKSFGESVERHGGFVARLFGDALLAFFGAPTSHENDAERSIRAGLDILQDAKRHAETITAKYAVNSFNVRVGINTGLVALGEVGGAGMEYTAMGDAINVASHLESAAPPGKILVSHDTYRHVQGIFDITEAEKMQFKGRQELTQTYIVHFAKPRGFYVVERMVEGIETRMIGRDAQLETLKQSYQQTVQNNRTHLVTITGEAGVGKSRLLAEFDLWVEKLDGTVRYFSARATVQASNVSYGLFHNLFVSIFDIHDTDEIGTVTKKLEAGIGIYLDVEHAHVIGELLGFDFSSSPHVQQFHGDSVRLHDVGTQYIADFFTASTRHRIEEDAEGEFEHTVLFLEDLQWADPGSLELLSYMVEECPGIPLLIVCIARPNFYDQYPEWGKDFPEFVHIKLSPLTKDESNILVEEILRKVDNIPQSLKQLIIKNANGNPFYIEELIKMLVEEGVVVKGDEHWWIEESKLRGLKVPPTLTGVVQARMDKLPPAERELLQRAAVIGTVFWDDALAMLRANEVDVGVIPEFIDDLQSHELIVSHPDSAFDGTHEFIFKSAILREVAYESVLRRHRTKFHIQIAEWLEVHGGDRRNEYVGLIAEHYILGGNNEKAIQYLQKAISIALNVGDLRVAIRDLERILQLLPAKGEDEKLITLEVQIANAYLHLSDFDMAQSRLLDGLAIARKLNNSLKIATVLAHLADVVIKSGRYKEAQSYLDEALPLARESGDAGTLAVTLLRLGTVMKHLGQYAEAETYYVESLSLLEKTGHRALLARTYRKRGIAQRLSGDYEAAKQSFEKSLSIAEALDDRWCKSNVLNSLGELARLQEDYETAQDYYLQGIEIAKQIANHQMLAILDLNLGHVAAKMGNVEAAWEYYYQSLHQAKLLGLKPVKLHVIAGMAGLKARAGELEQALEWIGMVILHPVNNSRIQSTVDPIFEMLQEQLPEQVVVSTLEQSASLSLEVVVREEIAKHDKLSI